MNLRTTIQKPLTRNGINQAKAAHRVIGNFPFWRRYSSDLQRCQHTASIILGLNNNNNNGDDDENNKNGDENNESLSCVTKSSSNDDDYHYSMGPDHLTIDTRLRERAKGIREGRDKSLSEEDAMNIFKKERYDAGDNDETKWVVPLLEMEDEVWTRLKDWINDVVHDAYEHYVQSMEAMAENDPDSIDESVNSLYHVFVLTHSGTIRIFLERMVREQLAQHSHLSREETDKNGVMMDRLKIPNTSITRIDIRPHIIDKNVDDGFTEISEQYLDIQVQLRDQNEENNIVWKSSLIDITSTTHLENDESIL